MNDTNIRKYKWFWPWEDEKEEIWLAKMSAQGMHLEQANVGASYNFIFGEPKEYVYRLDFRDSMERDGKEAYIALAKDMGWVYLCDMNGWQYFRKEPRPGEINELFTDNNSKIQKYKRVFTWLVLTFAAIMLFGFAIYGNYLPLYLIPFALYACLWIYIGIRLQIRIKQLKDLQKLSE